MKHIKVFEEFTDNTPVNEAMSLTQYYRSSPKEVKDIAKQIDMIIDHAVGNVHQKNELLDLITDLTDLSAQIGE